MKRDEVQVTLTSGDIGGLIEAIEWRIGDVEIEPGKVTRYHEIDAKLRTALKEDTHAE